MWWVPSFHLRVEVRDRLAIVRRDRPGTGRREAIVGVVERVQRPVPPASPGSGTWPEPLRAHLLNGGQEQPDEDRDDCYHHQKLNEREAAHRGRYFKRVMKRLRKEV